jgi:hypothetical protein
VVALETEVYAMTVFAIQTLIVPKHASMENAQEIITHVIQKLIVINPNLDIIPVQKNVKLLELLRDVKHVWDKEVVVV